jgi:hypothetical protein
VSIRARGAALVAAIVVAAGAAVLAATTSTSAATADLQFSLDGGGSWSSTPPSAVFDQALRVVPGDRLESTVLVRSTRSAPTVMMVAITNASVDDALFDEAITVQGDDGTGTGLPATRLSALAECDQVVPTRTVLAGQIVPVTLAIDISPTLAGHQAENAVARFDLEIGLTDPGAPTTPNGCPVDPAVIAGFALPGSAPAAIAYTGAGVVLPTLGVSALALAVGGLLALASRRRRERTVRQ